MKKKAKKNKPQTSPGTKKDRVAPVPNSNVALFIILVITFIAYIPSLRAGFVNWDDPYYVANNPIIKDFSNLEMIFTRHIQGNYHPLTALSLAINYSISGLDAWSYHLFNLLFHLFNCFLVLRLCMILSRKNLIIAFT